MKVGEKYVIEIDKTMMTRELELPMGTHTILAKIKEFNSLVFDENGLSKLEKLEDVIKEECDIARQEGFEEGKTVGYNEAFIDCNHDGCQYCEFEDRNSFEFPCCDCRGSHDDLYRPIMEKVNEIRKYDICRYKETKGEAFCITHIYQEGTEKLFDAIYKDGAVVDYGALSSVERVGRIDSLDEWLQEG